MFDRSAQDILTILHAARADELELAPSPPTSRAAGYPFVVRRVDDLRSALAVDEPTARALERCGVTVRAERDLASQRPF